MFGGDDPSAYQKMALASCTISGHEGSKHSPSVFSAPVMAESVEMEIITFSVATFFDVAFRRTRCLLVVAELGP